MIKEYECIVCDYKTVRKHNFDKHLKTESHTTKIKQNMTEYDCIKTDTNNIMLSATGEQPMGEPMKEQHMIIHTCEKCKYICSKKSNYDRHLLSTRHKLLESRDITTSFECVICNFKCSKNYNYNVHLTSKKHIQNMKMNENNKINNVEAFKNEVIATLMTQLSCVLEEHNKSILAEQTKMMIESQNKIITEISNKPTNNISNTLNNNQTNNQQFNLNMFLNETCKDAMNLSEFIENMQVTMEDMEKTGELGFAKGMSRIIMNNLNAIDVCKRPIHCSDVKRETLYVKNNGVWEKETDERNKTKEIIYRVSRLNLKHLLKWRDLPRNKGYEKSDHAKNDEFTNLVIEINKMREEEFDKIITSVSKHVAIDKERVKMSGYLN
jgi:hypothetical protein